MSVNTTDRRIAYTGDGSTDEFAIPFPFVQTSDIKVFLDGVLLTETTDYTIDSPTGTFGDGGTLYMATAPVLGASLVMVREVDLLQLLNLIEGDPLPADQLETALDKATMALQQIDQGKIDGLPLSVDGRIALFDGEEGASLKMSGHGEDDLDDFRTHVDGDGSDHADVAANTAAIAAHVTDLANPHATTKIQVGLANVTNDAQLKIASNLSDLADVATAKTNLGLNNVTNDAQLKIASNLSDLNDVATARSNLGLGSAALGTAQSVTLTAPLTTTQSFSVIGAAAPTISMPAATNSADGYATAAQITALEGAVAAQHTRLHALNDALDHSGNLAASQLPTGGNWALTSGLVINSGAAAVDFTVNRVGSGIAFKYDNVLDGIVGSFMKATATNQDACLGIGSGNALAAGTVNVVAIGYQAAQRLTTSTGTIAIGYRAGENITNTDTNSIYIGYWAGGRRNGAASASNVGIGRYAMLGSTTMGDNTGVRNVCIGYNAGQNITSGNDNVIIGTSAPTTTGSDNVIIGMNAGSNMANNTARNVCIGPYAGSYETGSYRFYVNAYIKADEASSRADSLIYGFMAASSSSQTLALNAVVTVKHGLTVNSAATAHNFTVNRVTSGVAFRYNGTTDAIEGSFLGIDSILYNIRVGINAGASLTSGTSNVIIGLEAGNKVGTSSNNTFLGAYSGRYQTGGYNVAVGTLALEGVDGSATGNYNVAIGYQAARGANVSQIVAIGKAAGNQCTGTLGTFVGYDAGLQTTSQNYVVYVGEQCGCNMRGGMNVAVGGEAMYGSGTPASNTGYANVALGHKALHSAGSNLTAGYVTAIGYCAAQNQASADRGICLGAFAGKYETAANKLFIDSFDRTDEAGGRTKSLIYGVMDSTNTNQKLFVNADVLAVLATGFTYYGDPDTDGTWRIGRSGSDLIIQRRESGSYVTKQTITA